jgi:hypothetical protein
MTSPHHQTGRDFPFTRTDEAALRADDPSLPQRARELIRIGEIGIVGGDEAALARFFHPDYQFHGVGGAELSREQLWAYFASCRAAFDAFTVTRQTIMSDGGDHLATRTRFAGIFARAFTASPIGLLEPSGKPFEYRVINIFRYAENGQLAEEWVQYDTRGFLQSLGARIDPPSSM